MTRSRPLKINSGLLRENDKIHSGFTKEQAFMTPEYRDALKNNKLEIIDEKDIRDDYHKDTWVRMVIARKEI